MRKKSSVFLIPIFIVGFLRGICAEDAKQAPSPAVIVIEDFSGNKAEVPGWQSAMGQGISEMLIESLESSDDKFQVLETKKAAGSQNEARSGESSSVNDRTKSATGGSAGSKRSAKGGAASSEKPETSDTIGSEKPNTDGSACSDFTFSGKLTQFTTQTSGSKIGDFISSSPLANLGIKVSTAHVQIEWLLVDSETKKVIKRGMTVCSASGSEFDMTALTTGDGKSTVAESATAFAQTAAHGKSKTNNYANIFKGLILGDASSGTDSGDRAGSGNGTTGKSAKASSQTAPKTGGDVAESAGAIIDYGDPAFMKSALGKATCQTITNIIEQLDAINLPEPGRFAEVKAATDALKHTPGKVLAVAGKDTIIVSLGSKEGFKEGDTLELYQLKDVKDDKDNVVFTDEKLVGEITLSAVQEDRSRASYAGDAQVQQGWTVKAK
ncbi:MAG TPA: CsgG/HfaB family protein [Verrucomicrobiae bacterium]